MIAGGSIFWFEIPSTKALPRIQISTTEPHQATLEEKYESPLAITSLDQLERAPVESTTLDRQDTVQSLLTTHNIDPSKIRILLVEDERMLLKFGKKMLQALGFTVDEAYDGVDGLKCMTSSQYDVVLMDQNMPRMGGLEAVRFFREWQAERRSTQPEVASGDDSEEAYDPLIFMVSASILDNDRSLAMDLLISDYFEKPLHVNSIATQVVLHIVTHPRLLQRCQRTFGE